MTDHLSGGKDFRLPSDDVLPAGASNSECGSSKVTSTSELCGLTEKFPHWRATAQACTTHLFWANLHKEESGHAYAHTHRRPHGCTAGRRNSMAPAKNNIFCKPFPSPQSQSHFNQISFLTGLFFSFHQPAKILPWLANKALNHLYFFINATLRCGIWFKKLCTGTF